MNMGKKRGLNQTTKMVKKQKPSYLVKKGLASHRSPEMHLALNG